MQWSRKFSFEHSLRSGLVFGFITVIISACVFLIDLGGGALIDYDEAAYAMVLEDTREAGQFASLTTAGRDWFDKPPLYFWTAAGFALLDLPAEWYMRLPSAFAGIGSALFAYLIILYATKRPIAACLGALILVSTGAFVEAGRQARMDAPIALCMLLGFYALLRVRDNPRFWLVFGAAVGIGMMTKSVVGGLPVLLLLIWLSIEREWKNIRSLLREKFLWLGALLGTLIALPWHVYETLEKGMSFWASYLGVHVFERYSENLFQNDVTGAYYFVYLAQNALPWVFVFAFICLAMLIKREWFSHQAGRIAIFAAISAVAIFALFGTAETVVVHYLVPLYPLFAITIGIAGMMLFEALASRPRLQMTLAALLPIVFVIGAIGTAYTAFHIHEGFAYEHTLANDEREIGRIITQAPEAIPVFFDRPVYWETIRYYSGRRTGLAEFNPEGGHMPPFFLVISTPSLAREEYHMLMKNHEVLYRGTHASLLFAGELR